MDGKIERLDGSLYTIFLKTRYHNHVSFMVLRDSGEALKDEFIALKKNHINVSEVSVYSSRTASKEDICSEIERKIRSYYGNKDPSLHEYALSLRDFEIEAISLARDYESGQITGMDLSQRLRNYISDSVYLKIQEPMRVREISINALPKEVKRDIGVDYLDNDPLRSVENVIEHHID